MARWFRFYNEALDDPKVQKLPPALFKSWVNLLCLTARHDGTLPPAAGQMPQQCGRPRSFCGSWLSACAQRCRYPCGQKRRSAKPPVQWDFSSTPRPLHAPADGLAAVT